MPLILVTLLGVANFYLHRAVMEGGDPAFIEFAEAIRRALGRWGSYVLEFVILLGALWFAREAGLWAAAFYAGYTAINWIGFHLIRNS